MTKSDIRKAIQTYFPVFNQLDLVEELAAASQHHLIPKGVEILHENNYINDIPLVIDGMVKVSRVDDTGREVFLYYIIGGQSCAMTLTSFLRREKSKVRAITMKETAIITLPVKAVYTINKKYPSWQHFIIETFSYRFDELIEVLESVAFFNMHERLIQHLVKRAKNQEKTFLEISHLEIAHDLATSREVISRILKQMEKKGLIQLFRNKIKLLSPIYDINIEDM